MLGGNMETTSFQIFEDQVSSGFALMAIHPNSARPWRTRCRFAGGQYASAAVQRSPL
jgi:hypothetical protein